MGLDGIRYRVTMRAMDGELAIRQIDAITPGRAVIAAEASNPGFVAELLTQRVVGRCERCGTVLFEGSRHTVAAAEGILFCGEC